MPNKSNMPDKMYHVYIRKHEAADFVRLTNQLHCVVELSHTNTSSPIVVSGKSLMGVLTICLRGMLLMTFPNGYGEEDKEVVDQILSRWAIITVKEEGECD